MNKCGDETSQSRNLVIICWSSVVAQLHHTQWGRLLYNPIIRVVGGKFCEWEIRRVCVTPSFFFLYTRKKNVFMGFLLGFFWCLYGVLFFYYSASWGIRFPIQLNCREYAAAGADTAHRHARRLRGRAEQYAGPSSRQAERN